MRGKKLDRLAAVFREHHTVLFGQESAFNEFAIDG